MVCPSFKNLLSNSQTLPQVFAPGGNHIVEVFESLKTMDTSLFSGHLAAFDALSHLMLSLQ